MRTVSGYNRKLAPWVRPWMIWAIVWPLAFFEYVGRARGWATDDVRSVLQNERAKGWNTPPTDEKE